MTIICYYILSGPFFRSAFIFSINSWILSGFLLTSFYLAEAICFLVRAVVQKYHEMSFIYNYSHFYTVQIIKFSIANFFSKYEQIYRKLWIWSYLLKKSLIENFNFCTVLVLILQSICFICATWKRKQTTRL